MGWKQLFPGRGSGSERPHDVQSDQQLVSQCYCPNGHNILSAQHLYAGAPGILLKLKTEQRQGLLSLSPIIGDTERTFHGFAQQVGDIVEICCPTCEQPFPIYNVCRCEAHLIALFTSASKDYAACIGICQRLGCLNAEIISGRDLRLLNHSHYC